MGYYFCTLCCLVSVLHSKKTTQIEEPLPLADSNFGEDRQLGDIFLHHSK